MVFFSLVTQVDSSQVFENNLSKNLIFSFDVLKALQSQLSMDYHSLLHETLQIKHYSFTLHMPVECWRSGLRTLPLSLGNR